MKRRRGFVEEHAARDLADLTIRPMATGSQMYFLRFNKGWGWAIVSVHDESGFLGIASDHGNWSFVWHPKNHGCPTLHEFLADVDPDYVAGKLLGARKDCIDIDATQDAMRATVLEHRRDMRIDKETARERWDDISAWDEDDLQMHRFPDWADRYDSVRMGPTLEAQAIMHIVWPAARLAIRQEVERRGIVLPPPRTVLLERVLVVSLTSDVLATPPEEAR